MKREGDLEEGLPPLPAPLARVVREGLGTFLALQGTRYRQPEDNAPPMPAVMMTKTAVRDGVTPSPDLSPAEWSELYRLCLSPLGDDVVGSLWGLVTMVMRIHLEGGAFTVSAGGAMRAWYRTFRLDEPYIEEKRQELAALRLGQCSEAEVEQVGVFFLDVIERCFFAGAFEAAAAMMETLTAALRVGAPFNPFSDDVETCIANVRRLLVASYTDGPTFEAWRQDANDQVYDAKRILKEGGRAAHSADACVRVAASFCNLCLGILLAISGDMLLVRKRCQEAGLDLLDYLTAVCAISIPFKTLHELHEVLTTSAPLWADSDKESPWLHSIVLKLFATETLGDMVAAMETVGDVAEADFPWAPEETVAAACEDGNESNEDDELVLVDEVVASECPSVRRFALAFMAAHVADICAPAVTAPSHAIDLTFARNRCISGYTHLFSRDEMLWQAAATYVAYSPLINPAVVYNIFTFAARDAAVERTTYLCLCAHYRTMLSPRSEHQRLLRRLLKERLGDHPTLTQWLEVFDYYCHKAYTDAHQYIIATCFNHGDVAMAAWLAVEMQLPSPMQFELRRLLSSSVALEDECVYRIGEAVHNSFLAVDACPTPELAHSLCVCAAVSEYRRAATAFFSCLRDPSTAVSAVLRSGMWCLQCVEKVLTRMDQCYFAFHPVCVFALVEHGADILLATRDILCKVGVDAYANLAGPVLPVLAHAFAICRLHSGVSGIPADLQAREAGILEKLSRALEIHT